MLNGMSKEQKDRWYDTQIDCAAIRMPNGKVWTGHRHGHVSATIKQATGLSSGEGVQGFVTKSKRFVGRLEAADLVKRTGQMPGFDKSELYSEDLY